MTGCSEVCTGGFSQKTAGRNANLPEVSFLIVKPFVLLYTSLSHANWTWCPPRHPTLLWVKFYYQRTVTMAQRFPLRRCNDRHTWPGPHFTTFNITSQAKFEYCLHIWYLLSYIWSTAFVYIHTHTRQPGVIDILVYNSPCCSRTPQKLITYMQLCAS